MSFGIDVNILLYASDSASAPHAKAHEFLRRCATGGEVFCLAWVTLMSYLRMATHPSIFGKPLTHDQAARNVEALMSAAHCRVIGEQDGFWDVYREVTGAVPTRGNLVPEAHLASLLRQHGVKTIYTHDKDFRKFDFLQVRDPLI